MPATKAAKKYQRTFTKIILSPPLITCSNSLKKTEASPKPKDFKKKPQIAS